MTRSATKKFKRFLAFIMVAVLLANCLPLTVFGANEELPPFDSQATENTTGEADALSVIENTSVSTGDVIGEYVEDVSRREENVKHFALPDGTYTAIVYPTAVHRKDTDGVWQDINNDLALSSVKGTQKYATTDSRVSFAQSFSPSAELMTLSENGYSISMSLISDSKNESVMRASTESFGLASVTNAVKKELPKTDVKLEDVARVDNKSSIVYNNVRANTDIEYILDGNDVKENIIVRAASSEYEYTFDLRLDGLVAILNENGSISVNDAETGEAKYLIPAPYMYDANGEISYAVEYTIVEASNSRYLLMVTADKTWINSTGREFPVTIDPTITSTVMMSDTYVSDTSPNANYFSSPDLVLDEENIALMMLDLPSLPDGATMIRAQVVFNYYFTTSFPEAVTLGAYQIMSSWSEEFVTYNDMPTISSEQLSTVMLDMEKNEPNVVDFQQLDITDAANNWYSNSATNHGIAIKYESGTFAAYLKSYDSGYNNCEYISVYYVDDFSEGVYALRINDGSESWMVVENDNLTFEIVKHSELTNSPIDVFNRHGLFKISKQSNTGRYVIRTMLNNSIGLGYEDGVIVNKRLPSNDNDVPPIDTFYITIEDKGIVISPHANVYSALGIADEENEELSLISSIGSASGNIYWEAEKYVGEQQSEININSSGVLLAGDTLIISANFWSTHIGVNTLGISIHSNSTNIASLLFDSNTLTAVVFLHKEGTLNVTVSLYGGDSNTSVASDLLSYDVYPPFEEGLYYIKNKQTASFVQIAGDDNSRNTAEQYIEVSSFTTQNHQKWSFLHARDGYYIIVSNYSNMLLSVAQSQENTAGTIVQSQYQNDPRMLWKIEELSDGSYVLRPKSGEEYDSDWCMSVSNTNRVCQADFTTDVDYSEEWILLPCKYQYYVDHYYDQGLVARANNINANALECIVAAQNIVAQRYMEIFNLEIIPTYTAYTSPIDTCKTQQFGAVNHSQLAEPCVHSPLHTTGSHLCNNLGVATPTQTNAIWTGHIMHNGERSGSYQDFYSILLLPWLSDPNDTAEEDSSLLDIDESDELIDIMSRKLFHEIAHQLGTFDHYCYSGIDIDFDGEPEIECTNAFCVECVTNLCDNCNDNSCESCINKTMETCACIMYSIGTPIVDLTDENLLCNDCFVLIKAHLVNHHRLRRS